MIERLLPGKEANVKLSRICYALPRIAVAAAIVGIVLALGRGDANHVSAQPTGDVVLSLSATGSGISCTPSQQPDKCTILPGSQLTLIVSMNTIPSGGFRSYDLGVDHSPVISKDVRHAAAAAPFLTVQLGISGIGTSSFSTAANTSIGGAVATTYTGPLVEADLNCPSGDPSTFKVSITLPPTSARSLNNKLIPITTIDQGGNKVADTLTINCQDPNLDSDGDGMTDSYENDHDCLDPLVNDGAADPDGDGRTNLQEFLLGSKPCVANVVGGITELAPEAVGAPLETNGSSGPSNGLLAGIAAAIAVGAIALGGTAWYARRRWVR